MKDLGVMEGGLPIMMARFGAFVLLVAALIVLRGRADCPEEVQETVSPDGGTTVGVLLDYGYGGAAVGSSTHIFLVNNRAIWNSDKLLTMEVTLHEETDEVEWRKTEALGVTIRSFDLLPAGLRPGRRGGLARTAIAAASDQKPPLETTPVALGAMTQSSTAACMK